MLVHFLNLSLLSLSNDLMVKILFWLGIRQLCLKNGTHKLLNVSEMHKFKNPNLSEYSSFNLNDPWGRFLKGCRKKVYFKTVHI